VLTYSARKDFNIMLDQRNNVFAALAQGWYSDWKYVQAIVQIAPKFIPLHHPF